MAILIRRFEAHRPTPIVIEPTKRKEQVPKPPSASPLSTPLSRLCQSPLPSPKKQPSLLSPKKINNSPQQLNNRLSPGELSLFNTILPSESQIRPGYSPTSENFETPRSKTPSP